MAPLKCARTVRPPGCARSPQEQAHPGLVPWCRYRRGMRKLARSLVKFVVITTAMRLVGMLISRAYEGDTTATANDFKLMALLSGRIHDSDAPSLRTGTAVAVMGGIDIDLSRATLDAGGAHIALKAYLGGIRMSVPPDWKVYVDEDLKAGGIEFEATDPDTLPDDAPRLTIEAIARSGGIMIEAS